MKKQYKGDTADYERSELKTCPFCGGTVFIAYQCGTTHHVQCRNNACEARVTFKDRGGLQKLAAAWNRRVEEMEG